MAQIELTDGIRQDASRPPREDDATAGYVVVSNYDGVPRYFECFDEAQSFALRQMENDGELEVYDVFPLYAAEPIEVTR